jgi:hypothetical protein
MHVFRSSLMLACLSGACSVAGAGEAAPNQAQQAFMASLRKLCGASFAGTASVVPADAREIWSGARLVATVASCTDNEVRVPVQVGADRSRTWLFRQTKAGLVLVHDHRHADGSPAEQSMYGGAASADGSAHAQHFSADSDTARRMPASAANVWHVTLAPDGSAFTYYLERKGVPRLKTKLQRQH